MKEEEIEFIRELVGCIREASIDITIFNGEDDYTGISYTVVDADKLLSELRNLIRAKDQS